jgi:dihydrofolate reductase
MKEPRISAIVALGQNREIGKQDRLLWRLDGDFARMKELIKGHPLIMGRRTYESIGRELPSPSVVITSDQNYTSPYTNAKHTFVTTSLEEALTKAKEIEGASDNDEKEVFIFGGSRVYSDALPQTERLYITEIEATDSEADSFFPEYKDDFTKVLEETASEENGINYRLLTLGR